MINQLGLEKVKHSFPGTLSGGENRRAVIARALINDPKVIIADEPLSNHHQTLTASRQKKSWTFLNPVQKKEKPFLL